MTETPPHHELEPYRNALPTDGRAETAIRDALSVIRFHPSGFATMELAILLARQIDRQPEREVYTSEYPPRRDASNRDRNAR
jgi:hypothetical protein